MNERIKDLLTQAGVKSETMLDDSSRDVECLVTIADGSTPSVQNWEKFAELIIEECANICYKSNLADSDAHAQNLLYEFNIDDARNQK